MSGDPVESPTATGRGLAEPAGIARWLWRAVRRAGWAPLLVFGIHVVISKMFDAYAAVPALDLPMHVLGGVAIAYFIRQALLVDDAALLGAPSRFGRVLLVLALVFTATVVWEFAEWTSDRLGLTHAQAGLDDTILDMLLGIVGGAAYLIARQLSRKEPS